MQNALEAYLDIETTGLFVEYDEITVVGICLSDGLVNHFVQLVGANITAENLLGALQGISTIYTYNGSRFDLPFIHSHLGVNLASLFDHRDLMYRCWQNNLYGGLKAVERQIGIERRLKGINGWEAIRLWWKYQSDADEAALNRLLEYNKEDVVNLTTLKERLL